MLVDVYFCPVRIDLGIMVEEIPFSAGKTWI